MKEKRSLSGIYIRFKNPESDRWENWCFEDLPLEKQKEIVNDKGGEWAGNLAISLADTLNKIAEQFDITAEKEEQNEG